MVSVTSAWSAAAFAGSSEPDHRVLIVLRNIAASAEGSVATASSTYDASFPASGAIDGNATDLNYGSASSADDGVGLSGWRSGSTATTPTASVRGNFTDASLASSTNLWNASEATTTAEAALELELSTVLYETHLDDLTNTATIVGQESWAQQYIPAGTLTTALTTTAAFNGSRAATTTGSRYGLECAGNIASTRTIIKRQIITSLTSFSFGYKIQPKSRGSNTADYLDVNLWDKDGNSHFIGMQHAQDGRMLPRVYSGIGGAGTTQQNDILYSNSTGTWYEVWANFTNITAASGASATAEYFVSIPGSGIARQIWHQEALVLTSATTIILDMSTGASSTSMDYYLDDIRSGTGDLVNTGTVEVVFDLGTAPAIAPSAIFTWSGTAARVERYSDTANFYSMRNNDSTQGLRSTSTSITNMICQTFQGNFNQVDAVMVDLVKTGSPPGVIWMEIRPTSGGSATTSILARSKPILTADVTTSAGYGYQFEFPYPATLETSTTYALVLRGNYSGSSANQIGVRIDSSAPGYANGQGLIHDGTQWTASASYDWGFVTQSWHEIETYYAHTNRDSDFSLGSSATENCASQGFKVPYDMDFRHAQVYVKGLTTTAIFSTGDYWWIEVQGDDGTGKPNNTPITTTAVGFRYDPALVNWTAYRLYTLSLPEKVRLTAGTQYHLVVRTRWTNAALKHLLLGYDASAPGYADGAMAKSDRTLSTSGWSVKALTWTAVAGDLIFAILGESTPRWRFDWASGSSVANAWAASYAKLTDNPTRVGSGSATFTSTTNRYVKIRAECIRRPTTITGSVGNRPWTPRLNGMSLKVQGVVNPALTVDFGS